MTEQVGRYRIVSQLGRGAMGVVYLAEDPLLHRQVAIKTVELESADTEQRQFLLNQLFRDARAAAQLTHPNIVGVYDVLEQDTAAYLVMEYVCGETLADRLRGGPMAPEAVIQVLGEMASALDYVHSRNIVHRDIKPANVMLDQQGTAKIMDFGIARISDSRTNTPTGMVLGTVEYMSPEQVKGEPLDGRTDQFALAAVAYAALTGGSLYGPNSVTTLIYKIVHEMPPSVRLRNPSLPAAVDGVFSRALDKDASARFATCTAFVSHLKAAIMEQPRTEVIPESAPTGRTPFPPSAAYPAPTAHRTILTVVAGLALLLVAVAGMMVWKSREKPAIASAVPAPLPPPPSEPVVTESVPKPVIATPKPVEAPGTVERAVKATAVNRKPEPPPPPPPVAPAAAPVPAPEPSAELNEGVGVAGPGAAAFRRGKELLEERLYKAAIDAFTEALAADPSHPLAHLGRGNARQGLQEYELAVKDYNELLRERPKNAAAIYQRGIALAHLKRDEEAVEDFESTMRLRPRFANPYFSEGMFFLRRQKYEAAIKRFDKAIDLAPAYAKAYEGRAQAKEATGDRRGAAADYEKARELFSRTGEKAEARSK